MSIRPSLSFHLLRSSVVSRDAYARADLEALATFVLKAEGIGGPAELTLNLTSSKRMQAFNRRFRGVDRPTDVIAFRYATAPTFEGDIAINMPQAAVQAKQIRHSLPREIRLLLIHGLLHLLGYRDDQSQRRRRMFQRQNILLRRWERKTVHD